MVGIHSESFGAGQGEEDCAYNGFGDCDVEESEDLEDDQAEEAGLLLALPEPWGGGNQVTSTHNLFYHN